MNPSGLFDTHFTLLWNFIANVAIGVAIGVLVGMLVYHALVVEGKRAKEPGGPHEAAEKTPIS